MRIANVLLLTVATSLAAQPVPVSAPTPLTNTRYGPVASETYASVATNGRTFVAAWLSENLVHTSRVNAVGAVGVGLPVATAQDRPSIAAVDDGYVVATTALTGEIRLRFLDANGRPLGSETAPVGYGFKTQLVTNGSLIALFYGQTYSGPYTVVLFDHHGNERLRRSVSPANFFSTADFAAATNGTSFEIIFSNGHDVYVESLDADGHLGPAIPVQIAAPANLLLVQVSIASSGHGYLAAWNTADGTLNAATISDSGEPGAATTVATPSAGKQIRRPRLAWNGARYACVYLDGGGTDYTQVFGTPRVLEIDPQTMTTAPHDVSAPESVDVSVAAAAPDRWFASWTDRSGGAAGSFAGEEDELYVISSGATAERVPAAASNGTSTLVAWFESTTGRTTLRAGISGADRSWRELGELAVTGAQSAVVASDGSNYLVAWDTSAIRIDSSGAILDRAPLTIPFAVTGAAWDGRAYVLVGASDTALVATTVPPSEPIGPVRQIRPKLSTEAAGNAHIASSGDGSLVTFTRRFYGFPIQPSPAGAILLDGDLNPRGEVTLVPDTSTDTAVAWNGSEYLAIICRPSTVLASRISRDGVLRDPTPRVIHDLGQLKTPVSPTIIATGNGYTVAWSHGDWDRRPLHYGYVVTLREDGTLASSVTLFDSEVVFGPLLLTRGGEIDIITSSFRTAAPYYGAARIDSLHVGAGASVPPPPRLTARPSVDRYILEWADVSGATGYRLQFRLGDEEWQEVERWFAPAGTAAVVTLQGNGPFQFRVRALGSGGPSDYSNVIALRSSRHRAIK
jgi:hypothetical protein